MINTTISFYIPKEENYFDNRTIDSISLSDHTFFINSERAWLVQTYLYLKNSMNNVICSNTLIKNAINIIHCDEMLKLKGTEDFFTVVIIADRRVYLGGNLCVVQNYNQIKSRNDHWIMHWPQANLIKSERNKQESKKELNIGFLGLEKNSIDIKRTLKQSKYKDKMNIVFRGPGEWNNYEDLDVVVAIRRFSIFKSNEKPATKLLNAWKAGVVFVGGNDSAYEQVGKPGVDYIRVTSDKELVKQLENLYINHEFKAKLIENGYNASIEYSYTKIILLWKDFLEDIATPKFKEWKNNKNDKNLTLRRVIYQWMRIKRFILYKLGLY